MSGYRYSAAELHLRDLCEEGFEIGPLCDRAISPTGEPFVELLNPGMKPINGNGISDVALATFREYAAGKSGTLYWRVYPEIDEAKDGSRFYMRVLISDKPAIYLHNPKI